jgi:endonuclease/exonuclease/phosphatase (EEP) superfamily protein YafD
MAWLSWATWVVALVPIVLTILSMWRVPYWWVRVWDYPRLQIAALLLVILAIELASARYATGSLPLLLATFACLCWQVFRIWRYTPIAPRQVRATDSAPSDRSVSIVIANVLQSNRQAEPFLRQVTAHDPDIVLAVETDGWWLEKLGPLREHYPHQVLHPLDNTYGMLLFSKLELSDVRLQDRVSKDIPSIFTRVRLRSGRQVDLHCVHPEPPQVGNDVEQRDAELLLVAREVAKDRRPTIVCGDLNDVAWSHTTRLFQRISGLLDPRVGRGLFPTFHADYWFARWPLDHVFHDACFRLQELRVLDHFGSDHFPVLVRLSYDPGAEKEQQPEELEPGDLEEAGQKIVEGREAETRERAAASSRLLDG